MIPMADIAVVIGGGAGVWAELDTAQAMIGMHDPVIIAANHAGRDYPGAVDHWATMHPDLMQRWIRDRAVAAGRPPAGQLWHARHRQSPMPGSMPVESWGGSSGLLCVKIALDLGFRRVILCGVPMDQNACHYDRPGKKWTEAAQYRAAWERRVRDIGGRVRSMSGWTAKLLGMPTKEWLDEAA
jgi:hypothetical protein